MKCRLNSTRLPDSGRLAFSGLCAFVLLGIAGPVSARTWRVPTDAPRIQAAVDSAQAGDDIVLAPGTYTWTNQQASGFSMITIAKPDLELRSEAGAAVTIIDGESVGRVFRCIDVSTFVLDGLTVQNGHSKAEILDGEVQIANHADTHGGAIYLTGNSTATIRNSTFVRNRAGGAGGVDQGGAVWCEAGVIENCQFVDNSAGDAGATLGQGGAIVCGAAQISDCTFTGNSSSGDMSAGGGAIQSIGASIARCSFDGNSTDAFIGSTGGAVRELGAGSIVSCIFTNNRVGAQNTMCSGGAVTANSSASILRCIFVRNEAQTYFFAVPRGGALSGGGIIADCVFLENVAHKVNPEGPGYGGAIRCSQSTIIRNCTLLRNSGGTAEGVGGMQLDGGGTVQSVILAYTVGQVCAGNAMWSCSDLFGNPEGDAPCGTDGGNNFTLDPQFCADDPVGSLNVSIQGDSPCAPGNHVPCGLVGGGIVGCGSVSVEKRSWSAVKGIYR